MDTIIHYIEQLYMLASSQFSWLREVIPSRRERIATAAMAGYVANARSNGVFRAIATDSVRLADAMIAELDKPATAEVAK